MKQAKGMWNFVEMILKISIVRLIRINCLHGSSVKRMIMINCPISATSFKNSIVL